MHNVLASIFRSNYALISFVTYVFLDNIGVGVFKYMNWEMGAFLSAVKAIACVGVLFCCYGIYQVLLWLWLLWMGFFTSADILLSIIVLLSFTIIYVIVTFAMSDAVRVTTDSLIFSLVVLRTALNVTISYFITEIILMKRENRPPRLPSPFEVTVISILFSCGMSRAIISLSESRLFLLLFISFVIFGLCISSAANNWINSGFSAEVV